MVWKHDVYNNMEYVESTTFFNTFEDEAVNFMSQREAKKKIWEESEANFSNAIDGIGVRSRRKGILPKPT